MSDGQQEVFTTREFCDERHKNIITSIKANKNANQVNEQRIDSLKTYVIATLTSALLSLVGVLALLVVNT